MKPATEILVDKYTLCQKMLSSMNLGSVSKLYQTGNVLRKRGMRLNCTNLGVFL